MARDRVRGSRRGGNGDPGQSRACIAASSGGSAPCGARLRVRGNEAPYWTSSVEAAHRAALAAEYKADDDQSPPCLTSKPSKKPYKLCPPLLSPSSGTGSLSSMPPPGTVKSKPTPQLGGLMHSSRRQKRTTGPILPARCEPHGVSKVLALLPLAADAGSGTRRQELQSAEKQLVTPVLAVQDGRRRQAVHRQDRHSSSCSRSAAPGWRPLVLDRYSQ